MEEILRDYDLIFESIPDRWLDGIMHGNGDLGSMVWRKENILFFTLDNYNVWEERSSWDLDTRHSYSDLKSLILNKEFDNAKQKYEIPKASGHDFIYRTRLPIPRFELEIKENMNQAKGRIHLWDSYISITSESNRSSVNLEYFIHATKNLILIKKIGRASCRERV
jgi:hypothetical protein